MSKSLKIQEVRFHKDDVAMFDNTMSGQLIASFQELYEAGCIQTGADVCDTLQEAQEKFVLPLVGLMVATRNNPCNGCPVDKQKCKAFQMYHTSSIIRDVLNESEKRRNATKAPGTKNYPGKSIAEIAKILGVSKGEVKRRKAAGLI